MIERNGTLELSWLHLLEFSEVTDTRQVTAVESFLDSVCPNHIGFIDVIPKGVIEKENRFLRREKNLADPHVDYELLKVFGAHRGRPLAPVSFQGFFSNQNPKMQEMCTTFMRNLEPVLKASREKAKLPEFARIVEKTPKGHPQVQHLTRYIDIEVARYFVKYPIKMHPNQWRDLSHMIVPMAYSDFVLLDKTWASISNQVQGRLRKAGHRVKMARIFSWRTLKDFWDVFESTPRWPNLVEEFSV